MSRLKANYIKDSTGNEFKTEDLKNMADKQSIVDFYKQGDLFTTFEDLNEDNFLKIQDNTVIDELREPTLYNIYKNEGKTKSKQNNFQHYDFGYDGGTPDQFMFIQFEDFKFFEIRNQNSILTEHTIDTNGNVLDSVDKDIFTNYNFGANPGKITWDVNYIKAKEQTIVYLKINFDLFCYIKDYSTNEEYNYFITDFFNEQNSAVKLSEKYVYELSGTTLYRLELPDLTIGPDSTTTTIFTKTDLETSVFTEAFAGATTSDFWGFGEDINIIHYEDSLVEDDVVVADKGPSYTDFYRATINEDGTYTSFTKISINPINYNSYTYDNTSSTMTNDNEAPFFLNSKSFIQQTKNNKVIFGSLFQISFDSDVLKTEYELTDYNVFNELVFQIVNLNDNSLLSHNRYDRFEVNGDVELQDHAFDIISFNEDSLSLLIFDADPANVTGSGQLNFNATNKIVNWNIVHGSYDESTNTYTRMYDDNFYQYKLENDVGKPKYLKRKAFVPDDTDFDYFYQFLNSYAKIENKDDDFYASICYNQDDTLTVNFIQSGYHFSRIGKDGNINTFIKR